MGRVIAISSDELIKSFSDHFDAKDFNVVVVSRDLDTDNSMGRVIMMRALCPPTNILGHFINKGKLCKKYVKGYKNYLSHKPVSAYISLMAKRIIDSRRDTLILCSKRESEYEFLRIVLDELEERYGIPWVTYKKFKKDPKIKLENGRSDKWIKEKSLDDMRTCGEYEDTRIRLFVMRELMGEVPKGDLIQMVVERGLLKVGKAKLLKKKDLIKLLTNESYSKKKKKKFKSR